MVYPLILFHRLFQVRSGIISTILEGDWFGDVLAFGWLRASKRPGGPGMKNSTPGFLDSEDEFVSESCKCSKIRLHARQKIPVQEALTYSSKTYGHVHSVTIASSHA